MEQLSFNKCHWSVKSKQDPDICSSPSHATGRDLLSSCRLERRLIITKQIDHERSRGILSFVPAAHASNANPLLTEIFQFVLSLYLGESKMKYMIFLFNENSDCEHSIYGYAQVQCEQLNSRNTLNIRLSRTFHMFL